MPPIVAFKLAGPDTGGPVTFPGFPGVWEGGRSVLAEDLVGGPGLETEDAVIELLDTNPHLEQVELKRRPARPKADGDGEMDPTELGEPDAEGEGA